MGNKNKTKVRPLVAKCLKQQQQQQQLQVKKKKKILPPPPPPLLIMIIIESKTFILRSSDSYQLYRPLLHHHYKQPGFLGAVFL
ncbi:hypothetical protein DERF_001482 [Dermatophagoides farinae]|uniref:Uncharacterized protein n=1 Tax=Dermatophagoides farinae TaxID=6954 RepID=A0A922L8Q0_DERFA|nr:hypothetical protein DERF_001482 [Dermatophagoides farinae]